MAEALRHGSSPPPRARMTPQKPPPPQAFRRPMASGDQFEAIRNRVNSLYGEFGQRPEEVQQQREQPLEDLSKPTLKLLAPLFVVSVALGYTVGDVEAVNTLLVLGVLGVAYKLIWKYPPHVSLQGFLAISLFLESSDEIPTWWQPPLRIADIVYYGSIKEHTYIPGMSLPAFFLIALMLLFRSRRVAKKAGTLPPRITEIVMFAYLGAVFVVEAWGIARGGKITPSFFQIEYLFTMPVVALGILYAIRGPEDFAGLGSVVVVVGASRAALCIVTYVVVASGFRDRDGFYVTTHSDTQLFVVSLVIMGLLAIERPKWRTLLWSVGVGLLILGAIALNNRRIAFVTLGIFPIMMYRALPRSKLKRRLFTLGLVAAVLGAGYLATAAAVQSESVVFKPARLVLSLAQQRDNSSESRDVENFNLIYTLRTSPVLGQGFGHEYIEHLHLYDLSDVFPMYRYLPHNGVLWLWSVGGVVGFTGLWFVYVVAGTFILRANRLARTMVERIGTLTALSGVIAFVVQIWGDVGLNSFMGAIIFGLAYAIAVRMEWAVGRA